MGSKEAIVLRKAFSALRLLSLISFFTGLVCLLIVAQASAEVPRSLTLVYSGEERGLLRLHGCGQEQVGGLDRRQTVIQSLREKYAKVLNLHTGNIIDLTDPNSELIYQTALEALSAMNYDAVCLGPQDLCLPFDSLKALHANHPEIPFVCTNLELEAPNGLSCVPYIVREVPLDATTGIKVAVVGLLSKAHETEVKAYNPDFALTDPSTALANLTEELVQKSDFVVAVFHATREDANELAKEFSWVDVLIVAQDKQSIELAENTDFSFDAPIVVGKTAIVTNPPKVKQLGFWRSDLTRIGK